MKIPREKWRTGRYGKYNKPSILGKSMLLSKEGGRCCLGHLGAHCGIPDDVLLNREIPSVLLTFEWPTMLFESSSFAVIWHNKIIETQRWQNVFALLNDAENIDDETREEWIRTGFRIILGIDIEFTGEYR